MGSMGTTDNEYRNLVDNIRLASVIPPLVSGENRVHELTAMDKAVKLHYIRGLYLFKKEAVQDLDIFLIKKPLYKCLNLYYPLSGRICRRDAGEGQGGGRPDLVIKCNDSGIRTVEADCRLTVDEWLLLAETHQSINDQLVYKQVLGPDLEFSPLVYVQFTWFKCGGLSIGLSWAHILGDLFSASDFIHSWATGKFQPPKISPPPPVIPIAGKSLPFSPKTIAPVGDHWLIPTISPMGTHTFRFTPEQISALHLPVLENNNNEVKLRPFHVLAAFMWKRLSNLRTTDIDQNRIAIVSQEKSYRGQNDDQLSSNTRLTIGTVEADFSVAAESDLGRLVKLIVGGKEIMKGIQDSDSDFVVYGGACLTFVDAEDMDLYGLELNGKKPVFANYTVAGVGDFGAVLVLPAGSGSEEGRAVTVIIPVDQIEELKNEMKAFFYSS